MRALCFLLFISLLTPLKGWGFTVFLKDRPSSSRSVFACMVGQISEGVEQNQLSPVDKAYFMSPYLLGIQSPGFFVQEARTKDFVLNPEHYQGIFKKLHGVFDRHEKGVIVANTEKEAEKVAQYLNQSVPGKKFAIVHSGLKKEQRESIQALYDEGKVNFLVTVKELDHPDHYPGMSLYMDLNHESPMQSFVSGVSHVLSSEPNKRQADIVSFMELNPDNVKQNIADFDQILQKTRSGKTRAELLKLRTAMQKAGNPVLIAIEKTADELKDYISRHGTLPNSRDQSELYQRFVRYQNDPAFIARLKESPDSWELFQDLISELKETTMKVRRSSSQTAERAARLVADYILKNKAVPVKDTPAYPRFNLYRDHPVFIEKLKENSEAWKIFTSSRETSQTKTAQELSAYLLRHKQLPPSDDSVYDRYLRFRDDSEFIEKMKESPEAWEILQNTDSWKKKPITTVVSAPEKVAQDVIAYILRYKKTPERFKYLQDRYNKYREDPVFLQKLKESPEAWEIFVRSSQSPLSRTAEDTIAYILEHKDVPQISDALYRRYRLYRDTPEFTEKLKENSEVWEIFNNSAIRKKRVRADVKKRQKNPDTPKRTAEEVIAYILEYKALPPKTTVGLYQRANKYQDSPEFIQKLKENPKAWKLYQRLAGLRARQGAQVKNVATEAKLVVTPTERTAQEIIEFMMREDALPSTKDWALYIRFNKYRKDPAFNETLKQNPEAWELFQELTALKPKRKNKATQIVENSKAIATPTELAAQDVIAYILEHKSVPSRDSALYNRYNIYRKDPAFIEKLKESPEAWKIFTATTLATPPMKTAQDVVEFILREKALPTKKDIALYMRMNKYRSDPEFIEKLKENPEAWKVFTKTDESPLEKAAQETIEYLVQHKTVPAKRTSALYPRFHTYQKDPEFISIIKENPEAWGIFQKFQMSPQQKAAYETIDYILLNGRVPGVSSPIYTRYNTYLKDKDFIAIIQENPTAWKIFTAPSESPAAKTAQDTIDFILEHNRLPGKDTKFYRRYLQYRDDPEFIKKLKENATAWKMYKK